MKWLLVVMVLFGDILVIKKNRKGFYVWLFVDGFFAFYNFINGNLEESAVFLSYAIMGIYGLIKWRN